ncbi:MAG: glycosyltransferase, partial [Candidatus Krumholzibacteria bacterium]|nr:glycosyltransferase [Candidatus Krumholzibacteria bacterium]
MRIGMVLQARIPPPDIRVEKEAQTLIGQGHEVHLLLERGPGEAVEETAVGVLYRRGVMMGPLRRKWRRYTFSFTFRDPIWRRAIRSFAEQRHIEVLHVHDLPLVREVAGVGRSLGIPVVADLHENYPAGLQVWYRKRFKKRTIYNYQRWARYEREILPRLFCRNMKRYLWMSRMGMLRSFSMLLLRLSVSR